MVLRFISGVLLLVATVALISEATRAQLGVPGAPFTPLLTQLTQSAPQSMATFQRGLRNVHPVLWDPVMRSALSAPAWASIGAIGLALGWLGRRRRRVDVFTN